MSTHIIRHVKCSQVFTAVSVSIECGSVEAAQELHRALSRDGAGESLRLTLLSMAGSGAIVAPLPPESEAAQ